MSYNDDNYGRDPYGTSKKSSKTSTEAADAAEDPTAKDNGPCDATGQPQQGGAQHPKKKSAKGGAAAEAGATSEEGGAPVAGEEGAADASIAVGEDKKAEYVDVTPTPTNTIASPAATVPSQQATTRTTEPETSKFARLLEKAGAVLHGSAKVLEGKGGSGSKD
ncbi:hypothetical protein B0T14DRAFT_494586 [Immersiella caudata]|uniref:Uncharacterized protein n=1 Tax=Immersiella caudata TaxID=314043 RepID=A0AA39WXG4_9PEZI|nr:hypothetical protein B0T14DRAFT_494586 [Immersiella caudata]